MPNAPKVKTPPKSKPKPPVKPGRDAAPGAGAPEPKPRRGRAAELADSVAEAVLAPPAAEPEAAVGDGGPVLRLKDLLDEVAAQTGAKKAEVKPILDATLARLGAALAAGQGLNLPGFGKARVVRRKPVEGGASLTVKLRQGADKKAISPLAEPEE